MFDWVGEPPETVGELARVLALELDLEIGFGHFGARGAPPLSSLNGRYLWDMHHESPVTDLEDAADRRLFEWRASFRSGRAECLAALRSAYGEPREVPERHAYGPFFVKRRIVDRLSVVGRRADGFGLEWFDETPDWAKPPPDLGAQAEIVRRIVAGEIREYVEFDPPMPALAFAEAFGAPRVVADSTGIYMDIFRVVMWDGEDVKPLVAGNYEISPTLRRRPTGRELPAPPGPFLRYEISPDDAVGSVGFTERRGP